MKKNILLFVLMLLLPGAIAAGESSSSSTPEPGTTPIGGSSALVPVPEGIFTQTDGKNSFSHAISAFKIGKYEVTYELWYTVYQ